MKERAPARPASKAATAEGKRAAALAPPASGIDFVDSTAPIQRLIVNVGHDPLPRELSKDEGWIVGSDLDLCFFEGGIDQHVKEFGELENYGEVGWDENIYLEGHGLPGKLGVQTPGELAKVLDRLLPQGYSGTIRSHNCSAGVGEGKWGTSGVEELAERLRTPGVTVVGAKGVTMNHIVYHDQMTQGTRAFVGGGDVETEINRRIGETQGPVNNAWREYVAAEGGIRPSRYLAAATKATEVSSTFYKNLESRVEQLLLPRGDTLSRSTSRGKSRK